MSLRFKFKHLKGLVEGISSLLEAADDDEPAKKRADQKGPDDQKGSGRKLGGGPRSSGKDLGDDPERRNLLVPHRQQKMGKTLLGPKDVMIQHDKVAWSALPDEDGSIYSMGGLYMFRPKDPTRPAKFWAAKQVKEKKKDPITKHDIVVTRHEPHKWRLYPDLNTNQKKEMGWLDKRDREGAEPLQQKDVNIDLDTRLTPFFDPEASVMGDVPGATKYIPGHGGGTPTQAASDAAQRAAAAKSMRLPDWNVLGLKQLERWHDVVSRKVKGSGASVDKRMLQGIEAAMADRRSGVPPRTKETVPMVRKAADYERPDYRGHEQPPEEKFGSRKSWGETSPMMTVQHVQRPPKKKNESLEASMDEALWRAIPPKGVNAQPIEVEADNTKQAGELAVQKWGVKGLDPMTVDVQPQNAVQEKPWVQHVVEKLRKSSYWESCVEEIEALGPGSDVTMTEMVEELLRFAGMQKPPVPADMEHLSQAVANELESDVMARALEDI